MLELALPGAGCRASVFPREVLFFWFYDSCLERLRFSLLALTFLERPAREETFRQTHGTESTLVATLEADPSKASRASRGEPRNR